MDVGKDATLCDGHIFEKLVELFIIAYCKLNVAGNKSSLLVISSGISGQFQYLSREIFQNGGEVYGCAGANAGSILSIFQVSFQT